MFLQGAAWTFWGSFSPVFLEEVVCLWGCVDLGVPSPLCFWEEIVYLLGCVDLGPLSPVSGRR